MRSQTTLNVESLPEVPIAAQASTVASHLHSASGTLARLWMGLVFFFGSGEERHGTEMQQQYVQRTA